MKAVNSKSNSKFPNLLDAWSTILGMGFSLVCIAGIMFTLGYTHGQQMEIKNVWFVFLTYLMCGTAALGITFANIASGNYISKVYHVSWWEQGFRLRGINFRQGIEVFHPGNLKICAHRIGLDPELVVVSLYALLTLDIVSLAAGFMTRLLLS